jgi:hypothetical protein
LVRRLPLPRVYCSPSVPVEFIAYTGKK